MKPILIIDPGHGGRDPGGGTNEYFKEKDLVLEISRYQVERFRQLGVPVELTREIDVSLEPAERTKIVRESGAKFCISNHINAAANPTARGVETIHSMHNDGKLAHSLFRGIVDAGMPDRRVFTRALDNGKDYYYMHRETGPVTTIIVEYGFATNIEDAKLLSTRWRDFAEAVVREFCMFNDLPYTPPGVKQEPADLPVIQRCIGVIVDGQKVGTGYLIENTSHIPPRLIPQKLIASVDWDGENVLIITKEMK